MVRWTNRNWLITGASMGFGRSLAERVLARGGRVAAASRNPDALADLAAMHPGRVIPVRLDVGDGASIATGIAEAEARLGQVDVLVNNAGYGLLGSIEESDEAEYRALMEVNFFGVAATIKAVLPAMRARRSGLVINFSSVSGVIGPPGSGFYAASKFAVEGLSESLRQECRGLGIRVLVVEPGSFRTGFFGDARKLTAARIADYTDVEARRHSSSEKSGRQPGDPERGADVILDAIEAPQPPERLALGAQAVALIGAAHERHRGEVATWAERSRSADHVDPVVGLPS